MSDSENRVVSVQDMDPLSIIPHGDRLLVEVLMESEDVEVNTVTGETKIIQVVRLDDKEKEYVLGWSAGLVINVGSGHRLDESDQAIVMNCEPSSVETGGMVKAFDNETGDTLMMVPSTVPMPFERGQVVMCAKYSGSDMTLRGKKHKIITQAHVLATFGSVKMQVGQSNKAATPFDGMSIPAAIAAAQRLEDEAWASENALLGVDDDG
jgi:co-chaperonin GroES (HSP10)